MVTQSETGQSSFFPSAQSATEEQLRWGVKKSRAGNPKWQIRPCLWLGVSFCSSGRQDVRHCPRVTEG